MAISRVKPREGHSSGTLTLASSKCVFKQVCFHARDMHKCVTHVCTHVDKLLDLLVVCDIGGGVTVSVLHYGVGAILQEILHDL